MLYLIVMFSIEYLLVIIPLIFIAMSVHEMMHAFTAHWLGDPTASELGRVSLNPIRHIDPFFTIALPVILVLLGQPPILAAKPVPFNPNRVKYDEFGAALVGIAGPLTNFLLAVATAGIIRAFGLSGVVLDIAGLFVALNVALFVFNMLPLPPLDGSRLLYAVAPEPLQRVMEQIESLGLFGLILILMVLTPFIGPLIVEGNQAILNLLLPGSISV